MTRAGTTPKNPRASLMEMTITGSSYRDHRGSTPKSKSRPEAVVPSALAPAAIEEAKFAGPQRDFRCYSIRAWSQLFDSQCDSVFGSRSRARSHGAEFPDDELAGVSLRRHLHQDEFIAVRGRRQPPREASRPRGLLPEIEVERWLLIQRSDAGGGDRIIAFHFPLTMPYVIADANMPPLLACENTVGSIWVSFSGPPPESR